MNPITLPQFRTDPILRGRLAAEARRSRARTLATVAATLAARLAERLFPPKSPVRELARLG